MLLRYSLYLLLLTTLFACSESNSYFSSPRQPSEYNEDLQMQVEDVETKIYQQPIYTTREVFQPTLKSGGLAPKMMPIPKGSFRMGDIQRDTVHYDGWGYYEGHKDESPIHHVKINYDFAMSQYEVTKGEFAQFVKATQYKTDIEKSGGCYSHWSGLHKKWERVKNSNWRNIENEDFEYEDNHPVICIS